LTDVSISISKKIVHLTRVATGAKAGFKTESDVLIYPSQTSMVIEVGTWNRGRSFGESSSGSRTQEHPSEKAVLQAEGGACLSLLYREGILRHAYTSARLLRAGKGSDERGWETGFDYATARPLAAS
jgi:hypothetical protein